MNFLPIVFLLFVFGGGSLQGMKDLLSRIDLSSFSPLFPFLGIDKKTADFLCGEEFSSLLEGNADVRSLLPVLGNLFLKKNEDPEEKNEAEETSPKKPLSLDPIRNIATGDIEAALGNYFR